MRFNASHVVVLLALSGSLTACAPMAGRETVGEYLDDATITGNIKASIIKARSLRAYQIHVETFQGVVQLTGFVDSLRHAKEAEYIAKRVKGVKGVRNNIIIR